MHPTFTNPNPFSATPGGHPMPDGIIYQLPVSPLIYRNGDISMESPS